MENEISLGLNDINCDEYESNNIDIKKYINQAKEICKEKGISLLNVDDKLIKIACQTSNINIVKWIYQNKNYPKNPDHTKFIDTACKYGSIEIVKYLLQILCPPFKDFGFQYSDNSINTACQYGHLEIVKYFHEMKYDMELRGYEENRPIHYACLYGKIEIVKYLHGINCDIEAKNYWLELPIHFACRNGQLETVKYLHCINCDMEAGDKNNQRPIHYACHSDNIELIKYFYEIKCDMESLDKFGQRPIHHACSFGTVEIVKYLHDIKCDMESLDNINRLPIHMACKYGKIDIVKYLKEINCKIGSADKINNEPVDYACKENHLEIVKYFLEIKSIGYDVDKKIEKLVKMAIDSDNSKMIYMIYEMNPDYVISNQPLIHYICKRNKEDILKYFHQMQCNMEISDYKNRYPIHVACKNDCLETVRFLKGIKCNMEQCDDKNQRPIHLACKNGNLRVVKYLHNIKCDMEPYNINNKKPTDLAYEKGYNNICEYLRNIKYPKEESEDNDLQSCSQIQEKIKFDKMRKRVLSAMKPKCDWFCNHQFCLKTISTESKHLIVLGHGTFSDVYKLRDRKTKINVICKYVEVDEELSKGLKEMIFSFTNLYESETISKYFGSVILMDKLYIFSEFMDGESVHDRIIESGSLGHWKIIKITEQILEGLIFLHKNQIIHGNLKPTNIFLDYKENVKLNDYGLRNALYTMMIKSGTKSQAIKLLRTLNYLAPEIINGEEFGYPSDIWALGGSIIEMLTGKPPYYDLNQTDLRIKIGTNKTIEFHPCKVISKNMKLFISQCLEPKPLERVSAKTLLQFIKNNDMANF